MCVCKSVFWSKSKIYIYFFLLQVIIKKAVTHCHRCFLPQKDTLLWGQIVPPTNPKDSTMANVSTNCHVLVTKCSTPKSTNMAVKELNRRYQHLIFVRRNLWSLIHMPYFLDSVDTINLINLQFAVNFGRSEGHYIKCSY